MSADALEELWSLDVAGRDSDFPTRTKVTMAGVWRLDRDWREFQGVLVVDETEGFVWQARAQLGMVVVRGHDAYRNGLGEMSWKLFGRIDAMVANGADIDRSLGDRYRAETIWLPQSLTKAAERSLELGFGPDGELRDFALQRWGQAPGETDYGLHRFGGHVEETAVFEGVRMPSRLRVGWFAGTERFGDGELLKIEVKAVEFR